MTAEPDFSVPLEMTIDHKDFFRLFARMFPEGSYTVVGSRITVPDGDQRIEVSLAQERIRAIGPTMKFTVTDVKIAFFGFGLKEKDAFMERFRLNYQRGGG